MIIFLQLLKRRKEVLYLYSLGGLEGIAKHKFHVGHLLKGWYLQHIDGNLRKKGEKLLLINKKREIRLNFVLRNPLLCYIYN